MYLIYRSCYFPSLLKKFYSSLCCFHARFTVKINYRGFFCGGEFHNYLWCFLLQPFYRLLHISFIKNIIHLLVFYLLVHVSINMSTCTKTICGYFLRSFTLYMCKLCPFQALSSVSITYRK